jgi:hypothetical protein
MVDEFMAWYGAHGLEHAGVGDTARCNLLVHHPRARLILIVHVR